MDEKKSLADANKSDDSNPEDKAEQAIENENDRLKKEIKQLKAEASKTGSTDDNGLKKIGSETEHAEKRIEKEIESENSRLRKELEEQKRQQEQERLEKLKAESLKLEKIKEQVIQEKSEAHVAPQKQKKGSKFAKLITKLKAFRFGGIKSKLDHYWFEYSRVLHLARKPTRKEYRELAIMVIVGTLIIGGIGFVVQLIIQSV